MCSSRFRLKTEHFQVLHNAVVETVVSVDVEITRWEATDCVKILTLFV